MHADSCDSCSTPIATARMHQGETELGWSLPDNTPMHGHIPSTPVLRDRERPFQRFIPGFLAASKLTFQYTEHYLH